MDSAEGNDDKLRWGTLKINSAWEYQRQTSLGIEGTFAGNGLPWLLAEDNPVISPCEEITLNKTRERRPYFAGDKLPAGEMDSTFLGKLLDWTLLGKF